ncbi:MAG TPA: aromatic acid/H+ symport family MFS transporter [Nakamurella sp.]
MTTTQRSVEDELNAKRSRTVVWVVTISTIGLIFDGYDLVVYGAVVSTFLKDPSQIGEVTPALAGTLGSYALIGTLVGALLAGSVGDIVGRRKVMLTAYAWFSVGMLITALTSTATTFGIMRFVTGLGVGALVATTGALVAEIAPAGKKNLCNAITYSGVPIGSLMSALLAILLLDSIGWRGMFMIGASPLLVLLPLAIFRMPESVAWLVSRGKIDQARALSERTGVPLPEAPTAAQEAAKREKVGFAGLFSRGFWFPTVLLGFMSASALMLVYVLNTWLPVLMEGAGFNAKGSLSFLLVLNGGAIVGALIGSRVADRFGPKPVVVASFLIGAGAMLLMTFSLPVALLLLFVGIVGLGTSGTQILIYGFTAGYYPTPMRGAGVAWCAGFGRLGGVAGPLLGGFLLAAGLAVNSIFFVLAGIGLVGALITLLVQRPNRPMEIHSTPIEPSTTAATS